ncbi:MAG TPA: hypothetical protein VK939_15710 [Longimicrobiales bacterium]|nr:hypothetical protein [Longimicrobiales bacterium]
MAPCCCFQGGSLAAQEREGLTEGIRIRIPAPSLFDRPEVGALKAITRDTLIYLDAGLMERAIPAGIVRRLQVSAGRTSAIPTGAAVGFAVEAAPLGGTVCASCSAHDDCAPGTTQNGVQRARRLEIPPSRCNRVHRRHLGLQCLSLFGADAMRSEGRPRVSARVLPDILVAIPTRWMEIETSLPPQEGLWLNPRPTSSLARAPILTR